MSTDTTMPEGLDFDEVIDICDDVSIDLARRYRRYVERDDIRQELLTWAWRRRDKVAEYLVRPESSEDPNQRVKRQGQWILRKTLTRRGEVYCRKVKAEKCGYHPRDEFFYDRGLIEDIIKAWVNGTSLLADVVDDHVKVPRDPAEGGNILAMEADVHRALEWLDNEQAGLLFRVYGDEVPISQVARENGVSRQALEQKMDRLLRKIQNTLGGSNPYS